MNLMTRNCLHNYRIYMQNRCSINILYNQPCLTSAAPMHVNPHLV